MTSLIEQYPYTPGMTLQDAAMIFLRHLAEEEVPDLPDSIIYSLYQPKVFELVEPTRVKHAIYQRLAKPHAIAVRTGQPQPEIYNRCHRLSLPITETQNYHFMSALYTYLNADKFSDYHTASSKLDSKIQDVFRDALLWKSITEVGFNAARLLSEIDALGEMSLPLNQAYDAEMHAWALELFDVAYLILRHTNRIPESEEPSR